MALTVVTHCPTFVRDVADNFKDLMPGKNAYRAFVAVLCGTIFGVSGYCDIVRFFLFSPSVSSLCSFFQTPKLHTNIRRRHRRMLQRLYPQMWSEPERFIWAIDDTLIKRSGEQIWGTYWWWDHGKKCSILAQKLLVVGVVDCKRQIFIPISWELLHRDLDGIEEVQTQVHEKGWERAFALLQDGVLFGFPKFTVVADSWFAGEGFFKKLNENGFHFVMEVRSNRVVSTHGRSNVSMQLREYFREIRRNNIFFHSKRKFAAERRVKFRGSEQSFKVVAIANKNDLAEHFFGYYVTNKLTWNASKVWSLWRNRWSIEVQFRDAKQIFTLGEAAVRLQDAVELSITLSMLALTVIRLEQHARVGTNKDQYARPIPAGEIVRELKLKNLQQGFSKLAHETFGRSLRAKISRRITQKNLDNKPTEGGRLEKHQVLRAIS